MDNKKRLHFGVVFPTLDNTCQYDVWNGIVKYAEMNDIHLTAFFGTYQTTNYNFVMHYETCFETISNTKSLNGVIMLSGFIAQNIGIKKLEKYAAKIPAHLPVVSISHSIPGVPSVLVDNITGIYSLVEHLIQFHGKKEIAFVKGPDGHQEAEERLEGYKKALAANGITFDERYVLPGYFSPESGQDAVIELLDKRKVPFDAIVASDDETAMGVLIELKNKNIIVPSDVAVTGFDDDRFSATFIPSISTARQDFFEIGFVSADTLLKKIKGEQVDDVTYVPPVFVARQSCGCLEKKFSDMDPISEKTNVNQDLLLTFVQQKFLSIFNDFVPHRLCKEWAQALMENIKENPFSKDKFLYLLNDILIDYNYHSKDFSPWHEALIVFANGIEHHHNEVKNAHSILATLAFATSLVHDIRSKEGKAKEFAVNNIRLLIRRVGSNLILLYDIDSLAKEMSLSLPELSIHTALVGLYQNPIKNDDQNSDRTIDTLIGFDRENTINMQHNRWNPILFSDYSTISKFDFERERRSFLFMPLFIKDEEVGVTLLPYDSRIPVDGYESLRINISTAVKGAELISKIQTLSITDELTGLLNRRGLFQFVYSRMSHLHRNNEIMSVVLFMDMDGLKYINDTYGHNEGDIAISTFAKIIKEALREEDIIGRMGGDEFVVFSSVKSKESRDNVVNRIRQKLDEYNEKNLHQYKIEGSIGCVILEAATKECFDAAMLCADSVLYEEKMEKKKKGLSRK
ncbi:MAG: GGDEF domain-containing protein [Treponema sp.]|nr:GGDEF domain-containing protein [Treponema sp.]